MPLSPKLLARTAGRHTSLKKVLLILTGLLVFASIFVAARYLSFRADTLVRLEQGSQVIETASGPIEYQYTGTDGLTVLFLHGTPGGYDNAADIDEMRVLTPSRPGYLRTPLSVGATPQEQASSYIALLDALEIDRVFVVGASGGGPSAIAFAANYPDRTMGLIAIEAVSQKIELADDERSPFMFTSDFILWAMLSAMQLAMGDEAIIELLIPDPANRKRVLENPEQRTAVASLMWSAWPISRREAGMANDSAQFSQLDLNAEEVSVPTLIIHGTADTNVPYEHGANLAKRIPHAQLHTIEGADHFMPFSHAEEMQQSIEDFLRSLPY